MSKLYRQLIKAQVRDGTAHRLPLAGAVAQRGRMHGEGLPAAIDAVAEYGLAAAVPVRYTAGNVV